MRETAAFAISVTCEVKGVLHGVVHFKSVIQRAIVWSNCMCIPSEARKMQKKRKESDGGKREKNTERRAGGEYTSTHPWGPLERCWNPDRVSIRVHDGQSARLRALEAEACARCTTPGHFSLFCSLWFWNKPSFRGTPWAPSGKVNSPGGTDTGHYGQPQRDNIDILMDKLFQWCNRLTISLNTSVFEFPFKLHAIISTEDSCPLKLSVCKFSFIPDVMKREQGVICNFWLRTKLTFFFVSLLLTYLDPSVKSSTPEPWKSPFSNWPV